VCKCVLLPPGDNPIAVNKYINNKLDKMHQVISYLRNEEEKFYPSYVFIVCTYETKEERMQMREIENEGS
jgi:hypothetical protein